MTLLRWCAAVLGVVAVVGSGQAADPLPERWNVLFCFADDWGRYAGCYAGSEAGSALNSVVRTPALDRVAAEGMVFRAAFAPAPSCTPCRSALLSGRHWWRTGRGAILQGAVWNAAIPSFPLRLRDEAGYHIGKTYKVWSPGTPADAPFGGQKHAYEKAGRLPNNFSEEATKLVDAGSSVEDARERIVAQVRGNFAAFLEARPAGRPWLYFFGPTTTHRTWVKGSGKRLWGLDAEALRGKLPATWPDVAEVREDVADYLGECMAFDAYVGALMEMLARTGEADRTVVVLSGDHGIPGMPDGKCTLHDLGTGVPLIVRWPGRVAAGTSSEALVTLTDLAPTFLELGGLPVPTDLDGRSLVPLLTGAGPQTRRDFVLAGRERHMEVARDGRLPYPQRSLRTESFLFVRNFAPDRLPMGSAPAGVRQFPFARLERETRAAFADMDASPTKAWLVTHGGEPEWAPYFDRAFGLRPAEELYDLRTDPAQRQNLAADPAHAAERNALRSKLMQALAASGDPRVTGDGSAFDRPPFAGESPER